MIHRNSMNERFHLHAWGPITPFMPANVWSKNREKWYWEVPQQYTWSPIFKFWKINVKWNGLEIHSGSLGITSPFLSSNGIYRVPEEQAVQSSLGGTLFKMNSTKITSRGERRKERPKIECLALHSRSEDGLILSTEISARRGTQELY